MAEEDKEKTTFYIDQGTYSYTKMPFSLKNARATYQRLVGAAFQSQIVGCLEAYVDDMVVKSNTEKEMIADVAETFDKLRRINMKLNLKKNAHLEDSFSRIKEDDIEPTIPYNTSAKGNIVDLPGRIAGERNYAPLEKLAMILSKAEALGKLAKYSVDLGVYDIIYDPHSAVKGQGTDVLGPLPKASGKVKFMIVTMDYFTKWIEAKPLAKTTRHEVKKFV
ncbi:reverse transcriptase domain-containing protein [Tanacetum coccineum]